MQQDLFEPPVQKKEHNFSGKCTELFFIPQCAAADVGAKSNWSQELEETAPAGLFPPFTAAPFLHFPVHENYRYRLSYLHLCWAIFLSQLSLLPDRDFTFQSKPDQNQTRWTKSTNAETLQAMKMHWDIIPWIESSLTSMAELINWERTNKGREREQNCA